MTNTPTPGTTGPEQERSASRRLAVPFVFAVVLVAVVMAVVLLITQPWDEDESFQREVPPTVTVTATP